MILCIINLDHTHWTLLVSISDQTYTTPTDNQILMHYFMVYRWLISKESERSTTIPPSRPSQSVAASKVRLFFV